MGEIPQDTKFSLFGFGPRLHAQMAIIANLLGIVALILGILAAVTENPLGLGPTNWLLVTIILFMWNLSFWFSAYFGAKEGYTR